MNSEKECIFCKIVRGELPCHKIWEDEYFLVILDIDPISDGHSIIISKKHFRDLFSLNEEYSCKVLELAKKIGLALKKAFSYNTITIMQTNGNFQDVPHFHLHVFGRTKKNEIKIISLEDVKSDETHLKQTADRIKKQLFSIN